jgi:hypothetical protein
MSKSMTAPMAIIKVNGVAVGKMKNIRISETITRGTVRSLGNLTAEELPATAMDCSLSCSFYTVEFKEETIEGALKRKVGNIANFVDTVLLQDNGVQVVILKRTLASENPNGVKKSKLVEFATINSCFADSESMDISEGSISGRDLTMKYLEPILYPEQ